MSQAVAASYLGFERPCAPNKMPMAVKRRYASIESARIYLHLAEPSVTYQGRRTRMVAELAALSVL